MLRKIYWAAANIGWSRAPAQTAHTTHAKLNTAGVTSATFHSTSPNLSAERNAGSNLRERAGFDFF